jgi:hypothetical protein
VRVWHGFQEYGAEGVFELVDLVGKDGLSDDGVFGGLRACHVEPAWWAWRHGAARRGGSGSLVNISSGSPAESPRSAASR